MCFDWIKSKLQRKRTISEIEAAILADYAKQAARPGMSVRTGHGGPNMPNQQPCPACRRQGVRDRKTVDGAYYICGTHKVFFVPREQRRPSRPVSQHSK